MLTCLPGAKCCIPIGSTFLHGDDSLAMFLDPCYFQLHKSSQCLDSKHVINLQLDEWGDKM